MLFWNLLYFDEPWKIASMEDPNFASFLKEPKLLYDKFSVPSHLRDLFSRIFTASAKDRCSLFELELLVLTLHTEKLSWADEDEVLDYAELEDSFSQDVGLKQESPEQRKPDVLESLPLVDSFQHALPEGGFQDVLSFEDNFPDSLNMKQQEQNVVDGCLVESNVIPSLFEEPVVVQEENLNMKQQEQDVLDSCLVELDVIPSLFEPVVVQENKDRQDPPIPPESQLVLSDLPQVSFTPLPLEYVGAAPLESSHFEPIDLEGADPKNHLSVARIVVSVLASTSDPLKISFSFVFVFHNFSH